ncbi:HAD-IA family hydrolase [Deinococcus navajonensis]|uniref:HAD-IA family hydrolase n=1 Tax=Deinococcus navajonensis TaxID=309884 RepID=A0ABV8XQ92_9DEIO
MQPDTHVLLLDVDGVLVQAPEWFGVKLLREAPELTREFFETSFRSASTGQSDLREDLPAFLAALGRTQTPDEFLTEWLVSEHHPDTALLAEVRRLRAAGWRVALATNQEAHRLRYLLEVMGLREVVGGTFASCEVGHRKPSPAYFAEVTRRLNLAPGQIVFWDDAPENVAAARDFGWQAHLYTGLGDFQRIMGT